MKISQKHKKYLRRQAYRQYRARLAEIDGRSFKRHSLSLSDLPHYFLRLGFKALEWIVGIGVDACLNRIKRWDVQEKRKG